MAGMGSPVWPQIWIARAGVSILVRDVENAGVSWPAAVWCGGLAEKEGVLIAPAHWHAVHS